MKKRTELLMLAVLLSAGTAGAATLHQWKFNDTAGTLLSAAADSGTAGALAFAGGDAGWTTDGAGRLLIQSATGDTLIQSNANMGAVAGQFTIQYDMAWNFATAVAANHREMFLISRTSAGANPAGNQFRFSLTNYSGTSTISLATQTAGIAGGGNYNNPVTLADVATTPSGTVSLRVTYTFNQDNTQLESIAAKYSLDGGATWISYALGGTFTPYAISDLGDLRIHGKGNYDADDYYAIEGVTVMTGDGSDKYPQGRHVWAFEGPAGQTIDMAPNTGSTGKLQFAGGNAAWTTDGEGKLLLQSATGETLVQSNANMGELSGTFSIQYDAGWHFNKAVDSVHREVFLISRTASGADPAGNQFRFSLTIYSGQSAISLATQTAGIAGGTNYNNPVNVADLTTTPSGTISLKVTYAWNEEKTQLNSIAAEYSLDGGSNWTAYDLGGTFTPYAITNLGDLRIHAKGNFDAGNHYFFEAVSVVGGAYPAATSWAGYPLVDGYADTIDWIGWVYPDEGFIYIVNLAGWSYMPESYVSPGGSWTYKYK